MWGEGLTPDLYWAHREELLGTTRQDLPSLVQGIVASASVKHASVPRVLRIRDTNVELRLSPFDEQAAEPGSDALHLALCTPEAMTATQSSADMSEPAKSSMLLSIRDNRQQDDLLTALLAVVPAAVEALRIGRSVRVHAGSGKARLDCAVAVCVAVLGAHTPLSPGPGLTCSCRRDRVR